MITLNIEGHELFDDDNVLIIKPGPYSERIGLDFVGFRNLNFKPDRIYKEEIDFVVAMVEGRIVSCHKITNRYIVYDVKSGLITRLEIEDVNLFYEDEMLKGKRFDYKTGVATTAFNVKKLFEREID